MKNILALLVVICCSLGLRAQTASDFTATDCNSITHNLFTELDSGKAVVVDWVMPCASCIAPSLSAYNEVQNMLATYPGKILYYLSDDVANTNCSTLSSWASTNGINANIIFSDANVSESPYGSAGMPKIVVLGNSSHHVYFNQNNGLDLNAFHNAIVAALSPTMVSEIRTTAEWVQVSPNPASEYLRIQYYLSEGSPVSIRLYDLSGRLILTKEEGYKEAGTQNCQLPTTSLASGMYQCVWQADGKQQRVKCMIYHD